MSFGKLIANARKAKSISQKELAELIKKEDGEPISAQYLNDIERDRRNPPSDFILKQFASLLDIDPDILYFRAGEYPEDIREMNVSDTKLKAAYAAFRKTIED
jgi:transcriptional regulator with XRE-family HTH domain